MARSRTTLIAWDAHCPWKKRSYDFPKLQVFPRLPMVVFSELFPSVVPGRFMWNYIIESNILNCRYLPCLRVLTRRDWDLCEKQEIPKFKSEKKKTRGTFCFQVVVNLPGYSQTTRLEQCYYPGAQVAGTIKYFSQTPWCSAPTCPASLYLLRVFRWMKLSDELAGKDILC